MDGSRTQWPVKIFAAFEGPCNPYPLAIFRIFFFSGLIIHFFPSFIWFDDNYLPNIMRSGNWNMWLYENFLKLPHALVIICAFLTCAACICGLVGLWPRLSAMVTGVGLYTFASVNSLNVQSLALLFVWSTLWIWAVAGGGNEVLSLENKLEGLSPRPGDRMCRGLIGWYLMLVLFFAGHEKLLTHWPQSEEMTALFKFPAGIVVRGPWVHLPHEVQRFLGISIGLATVLVQLGVPVLTAFRKTRLYALIVYELFFIGIVTVLNVPLLFYLVMAPGGLLLLDDEHFERLRWFRLEEKSGQAQGTETQPEAA